MHTCRFVVAVWSAKHRCASLNNENHVGLESNRSGQGRVFVVSLVVVVFVVCFIVACAIGGVHCVLKPTHFFLAVAGVSIARKSF